MAEEEPLNEDEKTRFLRVNKHVLNWKPPPREFDSLRPFNTAQAWEALMTLPSCQEIMIKEANQKRLNLEVGVNVTQEFPWKQLPYHTLRDHLFDDLQEGQMLYNAFMGFGVQSHVLVGYVPLITQGVENPPPGDPFILYVDPADAKLALAIIRNLETYERLVINKRLYKYPRPWYSWGSENEVNLTVSQRYHEAVDVEIQSIYPLSIPAVKKFKARLTSDVRDGYVELIPSESARFDNVARRRITVGIQSCMQRMDIEQQTDPTFPTNAWAQYFYEINEDEDCLDPVTEDEEEKKESSSKAASKTATPEPPKPVKPPPELSRNIQFLLNVLEITQVDMYRNDYPLISDTSVTHHTTPLLEETLCFANISKSQRRYVCSHDWYPALAGLVVTSYTFTTVATVDSVNTKVDNVQRTVLQPKPILMWSFDDNLNYKLEFEAPLEVTFLSFCPYDPNVLLGGTSNGQVILWDLQNRAERLDYMETLSPAQNSYRIIMNDFLKWTIQIDEDLLVSPATISQLENSQNGPITSIKWLGKKCFINPFGKLSLDVVQGKGKRRFFMTSSMDGSIAFWDLDAKATRKGAAAMRKDLPKELSQNESPFKNKVLTPVFSIAFNEPITGVVTDTPVFEVLTVGTPSEKNIYNYRIDTVPKNPPQVRQSCIISTFYGRIERISWLGLYTDTAGREEITTSTNFARVHDGPIIMIKRNSFFPWLFVSIGRNIFAVWKEDYNYSPIFWRKRANDLTAVAWSESKPSVFFLTRIDGSLEAWDILARDDDACLNDVLGGGIVTQICEHKPHKPDKLLGIGDYNSSLRMVKLPRSFYKTHAEDAEILENYILKEESRKKEMQACEQKYYERHMEVIEAKRQAEIDANKEVERIEKERVLQAARDAKKEEDAKRDAPTVRLTYTERMKRQWYEVNLNRLLNILMSRKRVNEKQLNQETRLEKEYIAYEAAKKESLREVLESIADDMAALRLRIFPLEIPDIQRTDMVQKSVTSILNSVDSYDTITKEINEIFHESPEFKNVLYSEFLARGDKRRKNVNKSLGGNTDRAYWYDVMREERHLGECNWGFEIYAELLQSTDIGSRQPSDINLVDATHKDKGAGGDAIGGDASSADKIDVDEEADNEEEGDE